MGNPHSSSSSPGTDLQLASQTHQPVILPTACSAAAPHVLPRTTKLRLEKLLNSDDLSFFDFATGEKLYCLDDKASPKWTERLLVDARGTPVVWLMRQLGYSINYVLKSPSDASGINDITTKQQIKLTSGRHRDKVEVELTLTDMASGEPLTVFVKEKLQLKTCGVTLWLARGSGRAAKKHCEAIGTIVYTPDDGCDVEVAAGVDLVIAVLFTIIFDEMIHTHDKSQMAIITLYG